MALTIGVDIGGTKIAAGVVDERGKILERIKLATPHDSAQVAATIAEAVTTVRQGREVEAVGLGAAGFVSADRATVLFAANMSWRNEPLRERIEGLIDLPVVVENDANVAAWGEARFGAGEGQDNVVLLTIGTGVGGGVIIGGRLLRGHFGIGAELGHYRAVPDGLPCGCGQHGCIEQYASGSALTRWVKKAAAFEPERAKILLALGDGTPEGIVGSHITVAARDGDPVALDGFTEVGTWIGQAMADMTAILDPGVIILGGGVSEAGEILAAPARKAYVEKAPATGQRPLAEVVIATLGPDAGIIGAADLARDRD
jgi:glucokinase